MSRDASFAPAFIWYSIAMNAIYTSRWNEEFGTRVTLERMVAATTKAVSLAPDDALAHARHSASLTVLGQFDAAAAAADRAFALASNDA
ncbi:MAG: hypothetical protein ABL866_17260, partial [Devosia sp.]